jgi:hypothetical protein
LFRGLASRNCSIESDKVIWLAAAFWMGRRLWMGIRPFSSTEFGTDSVLPVDSLEVRAAHRENNVTLSSRVLDFRNHPGDASRNHHRNETSGKLAMK